MTLEELAVQAQDLQKMFEAGQLSKEEFKELVQNILVVNSINNAALDLDENINTRKIVVGVIHLASMIA